MNKNTGINSVDVGAVSDTIDTSDWKTYRNNEYGITFKYPNKYIVDVTKQGPFRPSEETYGKALLSFLIFDPKIEPSFGRGVKPEGMATNLFDGFDFSIYTKDKEIYIQRDITSEREVWLQKEEIYREHNVMNTDSDIKIFIFSSLLGPYYITSFSGENKVVVTTSSTHYPIEIFQNILSTFKFIY